jgi:hypothetical protein
LPGRGNLAALLSMDKTNDYGVVDESGFGRNATNEPTWATGCSWEIDGTDTYGRAHYRMHSAGGGARLRVTPVAATVTCVTWCVWFDQHAAGSYPVVVRDANTWSESYAMWEGLSVANWGYVPWEQVSSWSGGTSAGYYSTTDARGRHFYMTSHGTGNARGQSDGYTNLWCAVTWLADWVSGHYIALPYAAHGTVRFFAVWTNWAPTDAERLSIFTNSASTNYQYSF